MRSQGAKFLALRRFFCGNYLANGVDVGAVFLLEDAGGEGFGSIARVDRDLALEDDRAGVEVFVYKMNGAARGLFPGGDDAFVDVKARICGQKARVDVDDAIRKCPNKQRRKQPHIARQADELYAAIFQSRNDLGIVLLTLASISFNDQSLNTTFRRLCQTRHVRLVADNDRDLARRYLTARDGINQRHHIRPAAGNEYSYLHRLGRTTENTEKFIDSRINLYNNIVHVDRGHLQRSKEQFSIDP